MRVAGLCLAAVAAFSAAPALAATTINVSLSGTLQGTQNTVVCGQSSPSSCFSLYPSGSSTSPFSSPFSLSFVQALEEGDNPFSWGNAYTPEGLYSGILTYSGGTLTAKDISFSSLDPSCRTGQVGCRTTFASATAVTVASGVPEPKAWALMLLGFLAVGSAARRQMRAAARPAYVA
jgi:hypothetical protein